MTENIDIDTTHERLAELFGRDSVEQFANSPNRPYDFTVNRVQIHGRGPFYLDHDEAVALRVLPVRTHSIEDRTLRLEFVGEEMDEDQEDEQELEEEN